MAKLHANRTGRPKMPRVALWAGLLWAGMAGLAGTAAAQRDLPKGYATQPFTPHNFRMPEGSGCAGEIARWRAIQDNDYASGNVGLKVYNQIQGEIARAESACAAGRDAEARALVEGSRRRHGYPG
jgi:hypothetical protein